MNKAQRPTFIGPLNKLVYLNGELGELSIKSLLEDIIPKQKRLSVLTLGNLKKQELHKPRFWRLLDELEGRHVSQLTLTQFTFDDDALFDQLLKATSNNLHSLDTSWCSFTKAE